MSFDLLAPHYTWLETVLAGPRLQRCRVAWLDELGGCRDILIAGVGHGHFLKRAAQRFPQSRLTCVDASAGMLRHAERRARAAGIDAQRLEFVHAALPAWRPARDRYDAIVTHFFLDCFPPEELREVVAALAGAARPAARWLLADFTVPPRGLARQRARAVHALMYTFFRRVAKLRARRVTEPDALLRAQGFALARRKTSEWGLLHSDLWLR
ncbi:MAG TPA: class I SAM-dependent methyltransferase [Opitutaceae bacterium]|nr:class I SAM-dependent methyltransferase [Opitutaceae bacterium]